MINDDAERLCKLYMDEIRIFYPGRADEWNILEPVIGIYDESTVDSFLSRIKMIREELIKCREHSQKDSGKYDNLLRNIDLRIFELEEYRIHERTCSFYTDTIFMTLCDVVDVSPELLNTRLNFFERACETAISNLDSQFVSKLDCINSIQMSDKLFGRITELQNHCISKKIKQCYDNYKSKLISLRDSARTLYLPYSVEMFEKKIKLYMGIEDVDLDSIFNEVSSYIYRERCEENVIDKENITNKMLYLCINSILDKWHKILNLDEDFRDSFKVVQSSTVSMYYNTKVPAAAYRAERINEVVSVAEIMIDLEQYENLYELELSLVHEIIGHHWLSYNSDSSVCSKLNINEVFDEGWSRYCEYYYATEISNNRFLCETLDKKLRKSFIYVFIGFEAYYYRKSINQIISDLQSKTMMRIEDARSATIEILLNPFSKMQYALGFIFFKNYLRKYDLKDIFGIIASCNYNFEQVKKKLEV